jgi:DNA repair exonuclease SbcCD ATPase subunit
MKILYLKLKNFIGIYNGMKKTEIELDFSKSKNKFIFIIGKNGSGKSTILNALHPFSSNIEEKPTFIRPNKDGYKEIHIFNDEDIYIIKHYYKASKTGHNVKSYIAKLDKNDNEIELNPNGNVESFLEQVLICLKVDFSFLKLSSLGKDIINFIDFKAADRKKYIGNMLKDINAYEKYYKRVTDISRRLQNSIKTISLKIDSINNKEHIDSSLLYIENILEEKNNLKERIHTEIGYIKSIVDSSDDIESILTNIHEYEVNEQELKSLKELIDQNKSHKIDKYEKEIETLQTQLIKFQTDYNLSEQRIIEIHENKEKLEFQINEKKEIIMQSSDSNEDIKMLMQMKKDYLDKIKSFDDQFANKEIILTKNELLTIETFLDDLFKTIETLQSSYSIAKLDKCYVNGTKIISRKYSETQKQLEQCNIELTEAIMDLKTIQLNAERYDSMISLRPKTCQDDYCPFLRNFIQFKNMKELLPEKSGRVIQLETSLHNLQNDYTFYSDCISACQWIDNILLMINGHKNLIEKISFLKKVLLNESQFIKSIVYNSLNFSNIKSNLYALYSIVEDFEE